MRTMIIRWLFEKFIPFKWINGHKTEISRWALFISTLFVIASQVWPEYSPAFVQGKELLMLALSVAGVEIGKIHKEIKNGG